MTDKEWILELGNNFFYPFIKILWGLETNSLRQNLKIFLWIILNEDILYYTCSFIHQYLFTVLQREQLLFF